MHGVHMLGKTPSDPVQQIDSIGVVVTGHEFGGTTGSKPFQALFKQGIHDLPGHGMDGVILAITVATPAIIQMREVEFVDILVIHEIQHCRKIIHIVLGQGEAQPHLDPALTAKPHTPH